MTAVLAQAPNQSVRGGSLDGDRLGQVARLVHIVAAGLRHPPAANTCIGITASNG